MDTNHLNAPRHKSVSAKIGDSSARQPRFMMFPMENSPSALPEGSYYVNDRLNRR